MKKLRQDDGVKIFLIALAAQLVLSVLLELIPEGDARTYCSFLIPQITFIGAALAYSRGKQITLAEIMPIKKRISPLALALTVPVTVGLYFQNMFFASTFDWLMTAAGVEGGVTLPSMGNAGGVLLSILVICLLPAICEEVMFRGAMLNSFKERGGLFAILVSGLIFSLMHLNTAQLVHQFIVGVALGAVSYTTGTLVYVVAIHFLNNLMAILLALSPTALDGLFSPSVSNAFVLLGISLAGALVLYPAIYALVRSARKDGKNINPFKYFVGIVKNPDTECYNNITENKKRAPASPWVWGLVAFLAVVLILNTLATTVLKSVGI